MDRAQPVQDPRRRCAREARPPPGTAQLDEHRGRVDLEERQEPELAAEPSDLVRADQRHLERLLDEAAHLEHRAEVGVRTRDDGRVVGRVGQRDRSAQELDATADVTERREVDPEDAHRPRFDGLIADRLRHLHRFASEGDRFGGPGRQHEVRGEAGQDACPDRRRRRAIEQGDGFLEGVDRGRRVAREPGCVPEPLTRTRAPLAIRVRLGRGDRVDEVERVLRVVDRPRCVADEDGRCARGVEQARRGRGRPVDRPGRTGPRARWRARTGGSPRRRQRPRARRRPPRSPPAARDRDRAPLSSDGRSRPADWPRPRHRSPGGPRWPGRRPRGGCAVRTAAARRRPPPGRGRGGTGSAPPSSSGPRREAGHATASRRPVASSLPDRPQTSARTSCSTCGRRPRRPPRGGRRAPTPRTGGPGGRRAGCRADDRVPGRLDPRPPRAPRRRTHCRPIAGRSN